MLGTLVKTGRVLELFSPAQPEWGVTELATTLGLSKSNVHDLVSSLVAINLLQRTAAGRYRLGWRILSMANSLAGIPGLRRHGQRMLHEMAQITEQTTHLAVWDGGRLVFLSRSVPPTGLNQSHTRPGCYLPAYCTASGKVLLAELSWPEVCERATREGFLERTPKTIQTMGEFRNELQQTVDRGYGINVEETDSGVCSMAVPVRARDGHAVAALGVSMPSNAFDRFTSTHLQTVKRVATRLSNALEASWDVADPAYLNQAS